jgi:hypothetical protein
VAEKNVVVVNEPVKEIVFTCKFCGETKPYVELVVMRHYFPQIAVCQECAKGCPKES